MNKATIFISGVVGQDTNLLDVIRQFKSYDNPSEVEVIIDSVGGDVDTGQSVFKYLRGLNIPVTTVGVKAYSIASVIFMAGDSRLIPTDGELMIHLPWASVDGGAERLEAVAKELRTIENEFSKFYSVYTNIDKETILQLLKNETFLDAEKSVEMGFATGIKQTLQAVAFYNNQEDKNTKQMTKGQKFLMAFAELFKDVQDDVIINALMIQDANGVELEFPDVEADVLPQVGDKATIDGKPAEGEHVMPEGMKYIFEAGELQEIIEAEPVEDETEDAEGDAEPVEDEIDIDAILKQIEASITESVSAKLSADNDNLKAEIKALKKLVGSADASIQANNTKPNTNKNNGSSNYLRA
jgi:ATP-dependent protease ClpP protease subunit